jgi:MSHA pilin protein MshA
MRRQSGFTLLELVIVIVVLGILAALAIPRFISLQREARIAVIDSLFNSLRSGTNVIYAKSAAIGESDLPADSVDIDGPGPGGLINTRYGYPQATGPDITLLFDNLSARYNFTGGGIVTGATGSATLTINLDGIPTCAVTYASATGPGASPVIVRNITGC